jgi:hypothetical protein
VMSMLTQQRSWQQQHRKQQPNFCT